MKVHFQLKKSIRSINLLKTKLTMRAQNNLQNSQIILRGLKCFLTMEEFVLHLGSFQLCYLNDISSSDKLKWKRMVLRRWRNFNEGTNPLELGKSLSFFNNANFSLSITSSFVLLALNQVRRYPSRLERIFCFQFYDVWQRDNFSILYTLIFHSFWCFHSWLWRFRMSWGNLSKWKMAWQMQLPSSSR